MKEYHKIITVYERDPETKFRTLIDGKFATPELEALSDLDWVWTEKVDGTNIRVTWDGEVVRFGGKTDKAQIYTGLITRLLKLFDSTKFSAAFDEGPVTLYGEGYGAKIQKGGGNYIPDGVGFVLFDVMVGDIWLERHNVEDVAEKFRLKAVPVCGVGRLYQAIEMARAGFMSDWGDFPAEGLVMRPPVDLFNRRGERIITKIKHKDFR